MSIPLPIPNGFKCSFYYIPYQVSNKIVHYAFPVKMGDSWMDLKLKIAKYAREYYKRPISPYHFVIAQVDKQNFNV